MGWLVVYFPTYFFHLVPAPSLFFLFLLAEGSGLGDSRANGQIPHDWPISSLEGDNEERGPVEATEEEWWNLEDAKDEGAKVPQEEWWKRI